MQLKKNAMSKQFIFSIRNLTLVFSTIVIVLAFSSCGDKNVKRFQDAAMNLDNTTHTLTDEFDYWPECGIRVTGSHLASLISMEELQKMLPCPLYVSGPHHDGKWDLENDSDFGHYNPKAIQYLADLAEKVVADKNFVAISRPLVDKYLRRQMHIMMVLHDAVYDAGTYDPETREEIFQELLDYQGECYDLSCYVLDMLNLEDDSYVYSNIGNQFLYFWARRWSDGTIDQFYQGLSTVFKAYYPDYEYNIEKYWNEDGYFEEEYWYDEEYEETVYNCELEEDAPVTDGERIKEEKAVEMLREAATKLDQTNNVVEDGFDYWPECGIRNTGTHLFSLISLKTLNKMLPCELYVSGPHHYNRWELESPYDFGHYNPDAISYLGQLAKKVVANETFVDKTKPLVDEYLKRQMLIMKGLYDGLNDKSLCEEKQEVLDDVMSQQGHVYYESLAGQFLSKVDLEDGSYVYSNTGEMFLYFWARRDADGTMELFHDILETVYSAYYSDK